MIACLGLTFKADVDDIRESPALHIVEQVVLQNLGRVLVVEPHTRELPKSLQGKATLTQADEAIRSADIVVLLVDHKPFKRVSRRLLEQRIVIDTRGCWA